MKNLRSESEMSVEHSQTRSSRSGLTAGKNKTLEFLEMPAAMQDVERIAEK